MQKALFSIGLLLLANGSAWAEESCPHTVGADRVFLEPWPQATSWYGSESLAVILPESGLWPTTAEGALIAVKLFWFSEGFKPGMESEFVGTIERLDEGPNDAVISDATNARLYGNVWTLLTGIDFKSAGCWQITGTFRGQTLSFVVETQVSDRHRSTTVSEETSQ